MSILKKLKYKKHGSLSEEEMKRYESEKGTDALEYVIGDVGQSISRPSLKTALKLMLGVLLTASVIMFVTGIVKYDRLMEKKEMLLERSEALDEEIEELQYKLGISDGNTDHIIRIAREKLDLHFPDEIVYYNDSNK